MKHKIWLLAAMLMLAMGQVSAAEKITYYHLDALGSPIAATDESGNLAWKEAYKPYGERIRKEDGGSNSQWFTGKQEDEDNGLTYFGARWYDSSIGRFMGIDPVGVQEDNIHSFNRFAYANNNPYKFVDPDGRYVQAIGYGAGRILAAPAIDYIIYRLSGGAALTLGGLIYNAVNNEDASDDGGSSKGRGKDNTINSKGGPPRDESTSDYLPDPDAEGAHTTLGTREGRKGSYTQGATFDKDGKFKGRTDVTDHGRGDHDNPHWHPATGPNSVKKGSNKKAN